MALSAQIALNGGKERGTQFDPFGIPISTTIGMSDDYRGRATVLKAAYDWRALIQVHALLATASGDNNSGDGTIKGFRDFSSLGRLRGNPNTPGTPGSDFRHGKIFHDNANLGFGPGLDTSASGDFGLRLKNFGVEVTPPLWDSRLTVKADFFDARTGVDLNDGSGRRIMQELDVALRFKHSKNATIELGYAQLHPFDRLRSMRSAALQRSVTGNDAIVMGYVNFIVRFGMPEELLSY